MDSTTVSRGATARIAAAALIAVAIGGVGAGTGQARTARAAADWAPSCADQDSPVSKLGTARSEQVVVCIFSQVRRHNGDSAMRRSATVHDAAMATLKSKDFSITSIQKQLAKRGYFRNGGGGFKRCSALRYRPSDTPLEIAGTIYQREGFVIQPPNKEAGVAFRKGRVFMIAAWHR